MQNLRFVGIVFAASSGMGLFVPLAHAKTSDCVKIKSISGTSCKDLRVEFDFADCDDEPLDAAFAQILDCRGSEATAQVKTSDFIYAAKVKKEEGAWSTSEYKAVSPVNRTRLRKKEKTVSAPAEKPVSPPPVAAAAPISEAKAEVKPALNISGFVDAQYQWRSSSRYSPKFLIQDGALYLAHVGDPVEAKLDIPVSMTTSGNSNLAVGTAKAQAYVQWKLDPKFRAKLGQFDTIFGFEGNDTVDIILSRQGSVYSYCNPVTHTGLQMSYDANSFMTVNAIVANPNDLGTAEEKNLHYGLQAVYNSTIRGSVGAMIGKDRATQLLTETYDAVSGITIAETVAVDFEANLSRTGDRPFGYGFLAQTSWTATETTGFAVRAEYLKERAKKTPASATILDRQYTLFVGPQFKLSQNAKLKLDYSLQYDQDFAADEKERLHGFNVALVYRM